MAHVCKLVQSDLQALDLLPSIPFASGWILPGPDCPPHDQHALLFDATYVDDEAAFLFSRDPARL
eukprot:356102-Alexandrium_andersonii.AAC.1